MADTVANATFQGADVDWYIKADNIILKNKHNKQEPVSENSQNHNQPIKKG